VLVLLNPKSGSGDAREVFNMHVTPVLNEAEVPYDLYVTKHSNFAIEFLSTRSLDAWCCVVAVGGDGLFHEIVNGLLQRQDWAHVLIGTPFFALKIQFFGCYKKSKRQIEKCHTSLSSLLNFQSIGIQTWEFLIFDIVRKKGRCTPLQKMRKLVKK